MDDQNVDENLLSKWHELQHYNCKMPNFIFKKWQIELDLHLVLVTLHGQFYN